MVIWLCPCLGLWVSILNVLLLVATLLCWGTWSQLGNVFGLRSLRCCHDMKAAGNLTPELQENECKISICIFFSCESVWVLLVSPLTRLRIHGSKLIRLSIWTPWPQCVAGPTKPSQTACVALSCHAWEAIVGFGFFSHEKNPKLEVSQGFVRKRRLV